MDWWTTDCRRGSSQETEDVETDHKLRNLEGNQEEQRSLARMFCMGMRMCMYIYMYVYIMYLCKGASIEYRRKAEHTRETLRQSVRWKKKPSIHWRDMKMGGSDWNCPTGLCAVP